MSARQLRKAWWIDFRFDRQRYRVRSPENSRKGAVAYEAVLRQKLVRGEAIRSVTPEQDQRFEDFAAEWLKVYAAPNNKPTTVRSKEMALRVHLNPHFGKTPLGDIGNLDIERFKTIKKHEGLSPKSLNNILSVLRTCLKSAVEWGYLESLPRIAVVKVPPQAFDFLTEEEARQLLQRNLGEYWHDMILCALHTGMRLGELSGLDWRDIDFDRRVITVQHSLVEGVLGSPKNHRLRYVPMSIPLYESLLRSRKTEGFVFVQTSGLPFHGCYAWRGLCSATERAGMRRIGWHVLRHTFASHLAMKGAPIRTIQALLGHSTIQMTERYSHLSPASLQTAISLLDMPTLTFGVHENSGQQVGNASR